MKPTAYFAFLMLGVFCLILTIALILMSENNQRVQARLQAQQQALNSGVLGQQGQQISNNLLQDMAAAAARDAAIRALLARYGYTVAPSAATPADSIPSATVRDAAPSPGTP